MDRVELAKRWLRHNGYDWELEWKRDLGTVDAYRDKGMMESATIYLQTGTFEITNWDPARPPVVTATFDILDWPDD